MAGSTRQLNFESFLLTDSTDVRGYAKKIAGSKEPLVFILEGLQKVILELRKENSALKNNTKELLNTNAALETRVLSLEERVSSLENRSLKHEAYSGRATSILTGIPETENENTVDVVVEAIKEVIPDFSSDRISTAHRNRKKSNKPRSITVVFSKIKDKDIVSDYRKQAPFRRRKIGAYHYASPSVLERKKELEDCEGVSKVYFDGPVKMFSVKGDDGVVKRHIISVEQLLQTV